MYKYVTGLYNQLLAIYFKEDNNIIAEKKRKLRKNMILVIYFLKVLNKIDGIKYIKKKVNDRQKKLLLKE